MLFVSLSPGQPSLVHSQEPWRHTLQESYGSVSGSQGFVHLGKSLFSHQVLQSWEMEDPGGNCRPMCTQEHWDTSTQRVPSKTLPTEKHRRYHEHQCKREEERQPVGGYRGICSHPYSLPYRPPECWDCDRWWSRTWRIHCTASQLDIWGLSNTSRKSN